MPQNVNSQISVPISAACVSLVCKAAHGKMFHVKLLYYQQQEAATEGAMVQTISTGEKQIVCVRSKYIYLQKKLPRKM